MRIAATLFVMRYTEHHIKEKSDEHLTFRVDILAKSENDLVIKQSCNVELYKKIGLRYFARFFGKSESF